MIDVRWDARQWQLDALKIETEHFPRRRHDAGGRARDNGISRPKRSRPIELAIYTCAPMNARYLLTRTEDYDEST